jgi:hypothetical protein
LVANSDGHARMPILRVSVGLGTKRDPVETEGP